MIVTKRKVGGVFAAALLAVTLYGVAETAPADTPLSPEALALSRDGGTLFIALSTANQVAFFDVAGGRITRRIAVPGPPAGLALSADGGRLFVACAAPAGRVAVIDVRGGKVVDTLPAGHTPMSPVLSPDGKTLFVCNRFNDNVSVIDLASKKELRRVRVAREPVSAALTKDGKFLLVANHLHNSRADVDFVAAVVSVIDVGAGKVVKELQLPNGGVALQEIRVTPDGRYAAVTHLIAHHQVPTTQLERGWMNTNGVTIIDLARMAIVNSVLLDGISNGAANPWGLAWTPDGKKLLVAHAGTHEISITDFPALLARLAQVPAKLSDPKVANLVGTSETQADVPNDLSFLKGLREIVNLPETDRGPHSIVVAGNKAYAANYYSDTLSVIDLSAPVLKAASIALGPKQTPSQVRKGEAWFHDATICFQGWQSCASCHPGGARTDALNWDLLNDGLGNPKNTKSMLLAHMTPPAMSLGVREAAEIAVRSGILNILFTEQPEEVPEAIDAYLTSLKPVPSPHLVNGKLSEAAERGRKLFFSAEVACAACHPSGLFTDLKLYDVGTAGRFDKGAELFDTPTLVETWRTAPYLHDGSAATMRDVLTVNNKRDKHGKTSHLTPRQIADLTEYVLSL